MQQAIKLIEPSATNAAVEADDLGTAEAICVPPDYVEQLEQLVLPEICRALETGGDWTEQQIMSGLRDATMLLWCAVRNAEILAIAITELVRIDRWGKICNIVVCAGRELRAWTPLLTRIEAYARTEGCQRVRISGRRGWLKIFPDYVEQYTTMDKTL
jgi:hypothetical protein